MNKQLRKKIEDKILKVISKLDPDPNGNVKIYKEFFKSLNDKQFEQWVKKIKNKETKLFFFMPNFIKNITNEKLFKIAEELNVKLFHKIVYQDDTGREMITDAEHLVLILPVRRLIQSLENKIGLPQDDKKISQLTGAVIKPSKGSKLDTIQVEMFLSKNLDNTIQELFNIRGGNIEAYHEFKNLLLNKGEASLSELTAKSRPRSIDTTVAILRGMGFDVNI